MTWDGEKCDGGCTSKVGSGDMTIEVGIREIKERLDELSRKIDTLVQDRETLAKIVTSQHSLRDFLANEPDLYSMRDIKVRYR